MCAGVHTTLIPRRGCKYELKLILFVLEDITFFEFYNTTVSLNLAHKMAVS